MSEKFQEHDEEYLTRCVVDTASRTVRIYSNQGSEKTVNCETVDEFLNVLYTIRNSLQEDDIVFAEPPVLQQ